MSECELCRLLSNASNEPTWIAEFGYAVAFVYRDQFYEGRSIVIFRQHIDSILELAPEEAHGLYGEMLQVAAAVNEVTKADKLNIAVLGNREAHLHWHIIPRMAGGYLDGKAPWPHPSKRMTDEEYRDIAAAIRRYLPSSVEK